MNTVRDRLLFALKEAGVSEAAFRARLGIAYTTWRDIINGKTEQPRQLVAIADGLRVRAQWLSKGILPMREPTGDVSSGPVIRSTVPLISWVQAGPYASAMDPEDVSACERIETTARVGIRGFALRVESTSMSPEFPPGTVIIVDPDLDPRAGDYVIVANGAAEATFKQLVRDGADWLLRPINPQFPVQPLPEHYRIVGVVVASERRYR